MVSFRGRKADTFAQKIRLTGKIRIRNGMRMSDYCQKIFILLHEKNGLKKEKKQKPPIFV